MQITNRNIETMNSIFWACMPLEAPPVHLMVAPMTHAAGVCSFPMLPFGGTNIFMGTADPGGILAAIEKHKVTHIYMPPTLIYMLLAHPDVRQVRLQLAAATWSMPRRRCRSTSWSRRSRCSGRC